MEKYYLNVPFEEKEIAKTRGARFDYDARQWYYTDPLDKDLFEEWSPKPSLSLSDLSDEQREFIERVLRGENVLVDACIGSGKTTAIQVLCNCLSGRNILYLTYNTLLKIDAKSKIVYPNVTVTNYHGFAHSALWGAGIKSGVSDLITTFNSKKPALDKKYDLLVIDEYQDIEKEIAEMLEYIKALNPDVQIVAVGDMQQKIYDKTTLDAASFIDSFLGEYSRLSFTKCFRLSAELASRLGNIWGKPITGVNPHCEVLEMDIKEVTDFLAMQEVSDILCLGARTGDMAKVLNSLEAEYPYKFNKNTVYASISDEDKGNITPTSETAIFTTYDSSKGLERKICVVFDYTENYWGTRANMPDVKYEILRNIFCVAASRGKQTIIFAINTEMRRDGEINIPLRDETIATAFKSSHNYARPFLMSGMFDFKYKEDVDECYHLLDIQKIRDKGTVIDVKSADGYIDLSPCVGVYQEATFFKNYDIDAQIRFIQNLLNIKKYSEKDLLKLPLDKKILILSSLETNQNRYIEQVTAPFVTEWQRELIHKRLLEVFTPNESVQQDCSFFLEDEAAREQNELELSSIKNWKDSDFMAFTPEGYSFSGRTDVIKDNIIYELKFTTELQHEHFLQLASYLAAMQFEVGILWNVKNNEMFEVRVPDRKRFFETVLKTVTKGSVGKAVIDDRMCKVLVRPKTRGLAG